MTHGRALTAILLPTLCLLAGCIPTPGAGGQRGSAPVVWEQGDFGEAPRDGSFRSVMLAEHNRTRDEAGTPPLRWNTALAADAQAYANELARSGRFEHADRSGQSPRQGENLWKGTARAFTYQDMIGGWIGEKRDYVPGRMPNVSRTGRWQDVGHYTQMVWSETTDVGCAIAANDRDEVLVCRYLPAGNVVGVSPIPG